MLFKFIEIKLAKNYNESVNNDFIEIKKNKLRVIFHPLGAAIYAIYFDNEIMTVTPESIEDFLKENIYHGKTIGPVCGRVKDGVLNIDGVDYQYIKNEGNNALHGGKDGLSTKMFDYVLKNDEVKFFLEDEINKYLVKYTLNDDDSLLLEFDVESKKKNPIALTNHSYFCLGEENLNSLTLKINANKFIEVDSHDMIPLKERGILPCLDFNKGKLIKKDIDDEYLQKSATKGFDHSLIFNGEPLITLSNEKYQLDITTSFDAVQIYSDNYEEGVKMINSPNKFYRGIAIEPQDNQLKRKINDGVYHRYIKYQFKFI